jgi:hypothetical protein
MAEFGVPFVVSNAMVDGVEITARGYNNTEQEYRDAQTECNGRVVEAGLATALTDDQLRENYPQQVAFVECMIDAGWNVGPPVSEAEWVASGGTADVGQNWSTYASTDDLAFGPAVHACVETVRAQL